MKASKVVITVGILLLITGIVLIVLGAAVFRVDDIFDGFINIGERGSSPNFAFLIPGIALIPISLLMIVITLIVMAVTSVSKEIPKAADSVFSFAENVASRVSDIGQSVKYTFCEYCGFKNLKTNGRCKSCGATLHKK